MFNQFLCMGNTKKSETASKQKDAYTGGAV